MKARKIAVILTAALMLCTSSALAGCSSGNSDVSHIPDSSIAPPDPEYSDESSVPAEESSSDPESFAAQPSSDKQITDTSKDDENTTAGSEPSSESSGRSSDISKPPAGSENIHIPDISDEDKNNIRKKTIEDFRTSVSESHTDTAQRQPLFKQYFIDRMNSDPCHYLYTQYTAGTDLSNGIEVQKSGSQIYYKMHLSADRNSDEETFISKLFGSGSFVGSENGNFLVFDDEKRYVRLSDSEAQSYMDSFDPNSVDNITKNLTEYGSCICDGKNMDYEIYETTGFNYLKLAVYFDGDQFYKGELYVLNTDDIPNMEMPSEKSYPEKYILTGIIYADFDLGIDSSLFDIPTDYQELTAGQLYSDFVSKFPQTSEPLIPESEMQEYLDALHDTITGT